MKKLIIAAGVAASMAIGAVALAQPGPGGPRGPNAEAGPGGEGYRGGPGRMMQMSPEDRAAMTDARIAGFKAMLRLNSEQERHWPALETAMREAATQRSQRMTEQMQRRRDMRENRDAAARPDPVQRLRTMADRMGENAASMRKLADAAGPLYASLDEGQKRRVDRMMQRGGRMMMGGGGGGWGGEGHGGHGRGGHWERHQGGPGRGEGGRL
ncbi:MAG: Spy/CpxP family protein refolding chaperone [Phreatobacter sp.]|uniref:Spy/CpxP family protein refolding chaperone n=1 Tax=Phreatobacter sp. TaxID=1966341 RepID=UPI00273556AC|nr:Spy/CpxP family protein refolding chaperone [Phreatobacter sp.]MDP2803831.1 Spy/CpxP family protein refolding chaperone [Phreatobacter sp.]